MKHPKMTFSYSKNGPMKRSKFSLGKPGLLISALLFAGFNSQAHAGLVQNLHEAQIDAIFSQAIFGSKTIDIRFNPAKTLYNSDWLVNEFYPSDGDLSQMTAASGLANSLTVPVFYIDDYTQQGQPISTVGLAWMGDNGLSLKTRFQADLTLKPAMHVPCSPEETLNGCQYKIEPAVTQADIEANYWRSAAVMAHELGHNLGLRHNTSDQSDLMYTSVASLGSPTNYSLTAAEVATILSSPFVQMDANGQRFISITPFSVLAPSPAAVPLPAAWWMFASGMGLLAWRARGKSSVVA